jgi:hypothetical protein
VGEINRLVRLPAIASPRASHHSDHRTDHQIHDYLHLAAALGANPDPLPPKLEITAAEMRQGAALFGRANRRLPASPPLTCLD